ncbi:MAG: amino acid adenylation domain-containing protein [Caldilineaceae bacterium]
MTTLREFLADLNHNNVKLWVEDDQLRIKAAKGVLTPTVVARLKTEKPAIIDFLLRAQGQTGVTPIVQSAMPIVDRAGALPLSFAQQRLWFFDQLGSGTAYNMPGQLRLRGHLDVTALRCAIQTIVERHEVLRTTYQAVDDAVVQVINPSAPVHIPLLDLQALPAKAQEDKVQQILREMGEQRFDLRQDLMQRYQLVKLAENDHVLIIVTHHIAYDAWSSTLFYQELAQLYNAYRQAQPSPLAPLARQYADFAHWQQQQDMTQAFAYWQQQLAKPLPMLELPFDYRPPTQQDHRGGAVYQRLSAARSTAIRAFARQQETTLFTLLLTTLNLLFHRYTGQEDIVIGVPTVGRANRETEQMIGLFINMLALRTDLAGEPTFLTLLQRCREVTLDAFTHQEMPFDKLVEVIQPDRLPGRDPLFEVVLNVVNVPATPVQLADLAITQRLDDQPIARRALTLYVEEQADQLSLELVYQRALFTEARMTCLLDQFVYLLEQVVADPTRRLQGYSLVTPATRARLPDLNLPLPMPAQAPITLRLVEWAARLPDQPAVEWNRRTWSYAELCSDAQAIGRQLLAHGVKPGDVVAIQGARSYGLVAAMFGVLFSGGVMLTVADTLPPERQVVMLEIARANIVLDVYGANVSAPAAHLAQHVRYLLPVDADTGQLEPASHDLVLSPLPALPTLDSHAPAYVTFTSGTTGAPKGILGLHQGLAHFLAWQRTTFAIAAGDRCAQFCALSFDVLLRDVFLAPTSGATLCLPPAQLELDGRTLLPWLRQNRITLLHPVPSLAQAWLQHTTAGFTCDTLRWTFFAGEPLNDQLVLRWQEIFPSTRLANFYGPAETTMAKCWYEIPAGGEEVILPGIQPVGQPLPQTQVYILNQDGQVCGISEPGEIVIRTPFRTGGYLNPPANERRFVVNPARADPQDLLYHTGDLGRYRPDGALDILGRVDDQVKINGIRVEPAEIKALLDQHPAVGESTVIAWQAEGASAHAKKLVAYVVPQQAMGSHTLLNPHELRHYMSQRLPAALVPSAFIQVDRIPVTANGKVNRRALPPPRFAGTQAVIAPRTVAEEHMAQIWQEVLGVNVVGVQDNFFELGGHSLLGIHLMAKIYQRFGQHLPLAALFESPTVELLVSRLQKQDQSSLWSPLVPIQPQGERTPFFCVPGAGGNVLYFHQLAQQLGKQQPFYGLQAVGLDGKTPPHQSIEAMAEAYIKLLQTVQPTGPYLLGGHSFGGKVAFEMGQQLSHAGHTVGLVALFDCAPPADALEAELLDYDEVDILVEMTQLLGYMADRRITLDAAFLRALPADQRLPYVKERLTEANLLPADVDMEHLRGWLTVFKTNYQITYAPKMNYPLPLVYFRALEADDAESHRRVQSWRQFGALELYTAAGSHFSMLVEPHVAQLAAQLAPLLALETEAVTPSIGVTP